jgi:hypothetical protein
VLNVKSIRIDSSGNHNFEVVARQYLRKITDILLLFINYCSASSETTSNSSGYETQVSSKISFIHDWQFHSCYVN